MSGYRSQGSENSHSDEPDSHYDPRYPPLSSGELPNSYSDSHYEPYRQVQGYPNASNVNIYHTHINSPHAHIPQGTSFSGHSHQISGYQASSSGHYTTYTTPQANVNAHPPCGNPGALSPHSYANPAQNAWGTGEQLATPGQEMYSSPPAYYSAQSDSRPLQHSENGPESTSSTDYEWIQKELPTVYIQIAPSWEGVIATKDTGTENNWIGQHIVDRFRLEVTSGLLQEHEVFNGGTLSSFEIVEATWCISQAQRSYRAQFRVVENAPFDVLFGRNCLSNHRRILDSKEARSKSASPLLVLVARKKNVREETMIEENRRKAKAESCALQESQRSGESSRSEEISGRHKARQGNTSSKSKEGKKHQNSR